MVLSVAPSVHHPLLLQYIVGLGFGPQPLILKPELHHGTQWMNPTSTKQRLNSGRKA